MKKTIPERLSNLAKVTQLIDNTVRTLSRQLINLMHKSSELKLFSNGHRDLLWTLHWEEGLWIQNHFGYNYLSTRDSKFYHILSRIICSFFSHKMFCFLLKSHQLILVIWNSPDRLDLVTGEDPSEGLAAKRANKAGLEPSLHSRLWMMPCVKDTEISWEDDTQCWAGDKACFSLSPW